MGRYSGFGLLTLLMGLMVTPLWAGPPKPGALDSDDQAWFYNRQGVTLEQITKDLSDCRAFGKAMFGSKGPAPGSNYGLVGEIIGAIAAAGPQVAYADDCMIGMGYRRFDIKDTSQKAFVKRFEALSLEQQTAYVSAPTPPEGILGRQWVNSYWLPKDGEVMGPALAPLSEAPKAPDVPTYNRWGLPKLIKPVEDVNALNPTQGEAKVFVTLTSPKGEGAYVIFERRDASGAADLQVSGQKRVWPAFEVRANKSPSGEAVTVKQVFVIPAGTYAISNIRSGRYDFTTFCLGTVAFSVAPNEAIDLGEITLVQSHQSVDPLAPEPLVQLRIDQPVTDETSRSALDYGANVKDLNAAFYFNGFPRMCTLFSRIYGLQMPGAPNRPLAVTSLGR